MPRIEPLQPSFNAGEINPRLAARLDFAKYASALEECTNLVPLPEGGLTRRPGSRYIAEVEASDKATRLLPFEASATQQHIIELNELGMHFFFRQGQLFVLDTDAVITNGTFDTDITGWDDRSTGGVGNQISHDATFERLAIETSGVAADDIGWAEQDVTTTNTGQQHVIKFRVWGDPDDRIEFRVGSTSTGEEIKASQDYRTGYHCVSFTPDVSPFYVQFRNLGANADKTIYIDDVSFLDNEAVEIDSPYLEEDLFGIARAQSADVMYMFHPDVPPYKLERRGLADWSLVQVAWQDGPYLDENTTPTTLDPGAATGLGITVTASSTEGINDGAGFLASDLHRLIRLKNGTEWGWAIIVGVTDSLNVTVDIKKDFAAATANAQWRLGSWSDTTGWPATGGFFEQRLYKAATSNQPQTLWASQTADFENHTPDNFQTTVEDDDALDFTLSADSINEIYWLSAGENTLSIGTSGGEWVPSAEGITITPLDITIRRQTTHGSVQFVNPLRVGPIVLFAQRAGRRIREFGFNFETDGFIAPDMTRLAQHITVSGIKEMAYQQEPDSLVWVVLNNGKLLNMTYRRDEDVVGWARHVLGGNFGGNDAVVESVATIIGSDDAGQVQSSADRNEVWVVVKRSINGGTKRYVEVLERDFIEDHDQEDAYYSDSLITFDGGKETLTATSNGQASFTYTVDSPVDDGDYPRADLVELDGAVRVRTQKASNQTSPMTLSEFFVPLSDSSNAALIVAVSIEDTQNDTVTAVTHGGQALTEQESIANDINSLQIWRLDNPPLSGDIVLTLSGAAENIIVSAMVIDAFDNSVALVEESINGTTTSVINNSITPSDTPAFILTFTSMGESGTATPTGAGHTEESDEAQASMAQQIGSVDAQTAGAYAVGWTKDSGTWNRASLIALSFYSQPTGDIAEFDIRLNDTRLVNGTDYFVNVTTKVITLVDSVAATVEIGDELLVVPLFDQIFGLDHLELEQVKVWGDGAILPDEPVCINGCISLETPINVAQVGLAYTHRMKTLKIEGGNAAGTALGKPKRIYGVTFILLNSQKFDYGPDFDNLTEKDFRDVGDPMDEAVPLFTGESFVEFDGDWNVDARMVVTGDDPAPFTLLAVAPEINVIPRK